MSDIKDFEITDGVLCKYLGKDADVVIPDNVTSIGPCAFLECKSLVSIKIPQGVINIGMEAFSGCELLTSVEIPDSVKYIGFEAFYNCKSLTDFEVPDSVKSSFFSVLDGCEKLPDKYGLIVSGNKVLVSHSKCRHIVIPKGVTRICSNAFLSSDATRIDIPDSVRIIDACAFEECDCLEKIEIPEGVETIGYEAFENCMKLKEIKIPDTVTSIGEYAFAYCWALEIVKIGRGVTCLDDGVFAYCPSIRDLVIPDSVTSIGKGVFDRAKRVVIKDFGLLKAGDRWPAVAGFSSCYSECSPKQISKYITFIKKNTSRLKSLALSDVRLLKIMVSHNCLIPEMLEEYLSEAEKTNNIEAKTILLSAGEGKVFDDFFDLDDEIDTPGIAGKTFVVTGALNSMTRDEFKKLVTVLGGRVVGSISGKTDYLVCNNIILVTAKVHEARSLGVEVISENQFLEMVKWK